jgi:hypothetical protein
VTTKNVTKQQQQPFHLLLVLSSLFFGASSPLSSEGSTPPEHHRTTAQRGSNTHVTECREFEFQQTITGFQSKAGAKSRAQHLKVTLSLLQRQHLCSTVSCAFIHCKRHCGCLFKKWLNCIGGMVYVSNSKVCKGVLCLSTNATRNTQKQIAGHVLNKRTRQKQGDTFFAATISRLLRMAASLKLFSS